MYKSFSPCFNFEPLLPLRAVASGEAESSGPPPTIHTRETLPLSPILEVG